MAKSVWLNRSITNFETPRTSPECHKERLEIINIDTGVKPFRFCGQKPKWNVFSTSNKVDIFMIFMRWTKFQVDIFHTMFDANAISTVHNKTIKEISVVSVTISLYKSHHIFYKYHFRGRDFTQIQITIKQHVPNVNITFYDDPHFETNIGAAWHRSMKSKTSTSFQCDLAVLKASQDAHPRITFEEIFPFWKVVETNVDEISVLYFPLQSCQGSFFVFCFLHLQSSSEFQVQILSAVQKFFSGEYIEDSCSQGGLKLFNVQAKQDNIEEYVEHLSLCNVSVPYNITNRYFSSQNGTLDLLTFYYISLTNIKAKIRITKTSCTAIYVDICKFSMLCLSLYQNGENTAECKRYLFAKLNLPPADFEIQADGEYACWSDQCFETPQCTLYEMEHYRFGYNLHLKQKTNISQEKCLILHISTEDSLTTTQDIFRSAKCSFAFSPGSLAMGPENINIMELSGFLEKRFVNPQLDPHVACDSNAWYFTSQNKIVFLSNPDMNTIEGKFEQPDQLAISRDMCDHFVRENLLTTSDYITYMSVADGGVKERCPGKFSYYTLFSCFNHISFQTKIFQKYEFAQNLQKEFPFPH